MCISAECVTWHEISNVYNLLSCMAAHGCRQNDAMIYRRFPLTCVSADNVDITGNYNQLFCHPEAEAAYTILCIQFRKYWKFLRGFFLKPNLIVYLCHDWTIQHQPGLKSEGGFAQMKKTMHSKPNLRYRLQPIAYNDQPQFLIVYSFLYICHTNILIHSKSGCPDSAENSNFPQKGCLRTRKLSVSVPES